MLIFGTIEKLKKLLSIDSWGLGQSLDDIKKYVDDFFKSYFFTERKMWESLFEFYENKMTLKKKEAFLCPNYIKEFKTAGIISALKIFSNQSEQKEFTEDEILSLKQEIIIDIFKKLSSEDISTIEFFGLSDEKDVEGLIETLNKKVQIDADMHLKFLMQFKQKLEKIYNDDFKQQCKTVLNLDAELVHLTKEGINKEKEKIFQSFRKVMEGLKNIKDEQQVFFQLIQEQIMQLYDFLASILFEEIENSEKFFNFILSPNFDKFFASLTLIVRSCINIGSKISLLNSKPELKAGILECIKYFGKFVFEFTNLKKIQMYAVPNVQLDQVLKKIVYVGKMQTALLKYGNLFKFPVAPQVWQDNYRCITEDASIIKNPEEQTEPKSDHIILYNLLRIYNFYANTPLAEKELGKYSRNDKSGWLLQIESLLNTCLKFNWKNEQSGTCKDYYLRKIKDTIQKIESRNIRGGKNSRLVRSLKSLYNAHAQRDIIKYADDNGMPKLPDGLILLNSTTVTQAQMNTFLRKHVIEQVLQRMRIYEETIRSRTIKTTLYKKEKKCNEMVLFLEELYEETDEKFHQRIANGLGRFNNIYDVIVAGFRSLLQENGQVPECYLKDKFYKMLGSVCSFLDVIKPDDSMKTLLLLCKPLTTDFITPPLSVKVKLKHDELKEEDLFKEKVLQTIANILRIGDVYNSTPLGRGIVMNYKLQYKKSKGSWQTEIGNLTQKMRELYCQLLSGEVITLDNIQKLLNGAITKIQKKRSYFKTGEKLINSLQYVNAQILQQDLSSFDNNTLMGRRPFFFTTSMTQPEEAEDYIQRHMIQELISKFSGYQTQEHAFFTDSKLSQKNCYRLLKRLNSLLNMNLSERRKEMGELAFTEYLQKCLEYVGNQPGLFKTQQLSKMFNKYLIDGQKFLQQLSSAPALVP